MTGVFILIASEIRRHDETPRKIDNVLKTDMAAPIFHHGEIGC